MSQYDEEIRIAESLGWSVDNSRLKHSGPLFQKGSVHLWRIRSGWQCADLVEGHYRNHRPHLDLVHLLQSE